MLKSISIILLLIPTVVFAADPFTIMSGSEERTPKQPQACIDTTGVVHVTFGMGDQVYYCKVDVSEKPSPMAAFRVPNMSLGMRRGPRIAYADNAIVISAIGGQKGKGADGDVLAYRSLDAGQSWLGPVKVNDVEASAREGMHAMTASEDGTLWCVWLDLRSKKTQLYASKSEDKGATWSRNQLVYRSPDGSICECCHPSIIAAQNSVHVLFRNSLKGNRDMYLATLGNDGVTSSSVVRLGELSWKLDACPMDGGMLAMDKNNQLATVWRRDKTIVQSRPNSGFEFILGTGEQPWIASDGEKLHEVWTSKREGDLLLTSEGINGRKLIGSNASFPIIVADQRSKSVYVLWEQRVGEITSVMGHKVQ